MGKEALTIWENRAQACPGLAPDPRHLALLLRLGRVAPALEAYRHLMAAGESPALNETRARFAAHFLVGDLPAILTQDPDFAADPLVRVVGLTMAFGDEVVQRDLAFDIRRGEVLAIVGASGCGKSTLLRHLIGLQTPAAGQVLYGDQDLHQAEDETLAVLRRRFGLQSAQEVAA